MRLLRPGMLPIVLPRIRCHVYTIATRKCPCPCARPFLHGETWKMALLTTELLGSASSCVCASLSATFPLTPRPGPLKPSPFLSRKPAIKRFHRSITTPQRFSRVRYKWKCNVLRGKCSWSFNTLTLTLESVDNKSNSFILFLTLCTRRHFTRNIRDFSMRRRHYSKRTNQKTYVN